MNNANEMTAEDYMAVLHAELENRLERNEIEPDVYTRREVQEQTGMSEKGALKWMKELMRLELADPCFTTRKDTWGRIQPAIPAMRLNVAAIRLKMESEAKIGI